VWEIALVPEWLPSARLDVELVAYVSVGSLEQQQH
jgi:hypothetical protein